MMRATNSEEPIASNPSAIETDIEATRARMGETLEELGTRLNPHHLKAQAVDAVHEATIGRVRTMVRDTGNAAATAGRTAAGALRDNAVPAALIAAGVGLLLWNRRTRRQEAELLMAPTEQNFAEREHPSGMMAGAATVAGTVREKAGAVAGAVSGAAQQAAHRVADSTTSMASTVGTTVSGTVRTQSQRAATLFDENPLAVGAVVAAIGVAAGFAMPASAQEARLLGSVRDDAVDKVKGLVQEKERQIANVAERVVSEVRATASETVREAAREEGLAG
jgi:hypothetical protein